ncbi:hypothetical protein T439DRAFT_380361, partial [Meredithblackwellia eburnea MCA 4105]
MLQIPLRKISTSLTAWSGALFSGVREMSAFENVLHSKDANGALWPQHMNRQRPPRIFAPEARFTGVVDLEILSFDVDKLWNSAQEACLLWSIFRLAPPLGAIQALAFFDVDVRHSKGILLSEEEEIEESPRFQKLRRLVLHNFTMQAELPSPEDVNFLEFSVPQVGPTIEELAFSHTIGTSSTTPHFSPFEDKVLDFLTHQHQVSIGGNLTCLHLALYQGHHDGFWKMTQTFPRDTDGESRFPHTRTLHVVFHCWDESSKVVRERVVSYHLRVISFIQRFPNIERLGMHGNLVLWTSSIFQQNPWIKNHASVDKNQFLVTHHRLQHVVLDFDERTSFDSDVGPVFGDNGRVNVPWEYVYEFYLSSLVRPTVVAGGVGQRRNYVLSVRLPDVGFDEARRGLDEYDARQGELQPHFELVAYSQSPLVFPFLSSKFEYEKGKFNHGLPSATVPSLF